MIDLTLRLNTNIKKRGANFAVFIEILSADWERILLHDNTNINIDITKTVTPVNVFFNIFDNPLKSKYPPSDFIIEKHIHMLMIGNIKDTKNFSTIEIKRISEALAIPPLVTFPVNMYNDVISGAKHSITLHMPLI